MRAWFLMRIRRRKRRHLLSKTRKRPMNRLRRLVVSAARRRRQRRCPQNSLRRRARGVRANNLGVLGTNVAIHSAFMYFFNSILMCFVFARLDSHRRFEPGDGGVQSRIRSREFMRNVFNRRPSNALNVIFKAKKQSVKASQVGHQMFDVRGFGRRSSAVLWFPPRRRRRVFALRWRQLRRHRRWWRRLLHDLRRTRRRGHVRPHRLSRLHARRRAQTAAARLLRHEILHLLRLHLHLHRSRRRLHLSKRFLRVLYRFRRFPHRRRRLSRRASSHALARSQILAHRLHAPRIAQKLLKFVRKHRRSLPSPLFEVRRAARVPRDARERRRLVVFQIFQHSKQVSPLRVSRLHDAGERGRSRRELDE
mmetsp:Transcript_3789/g.14568  ORF Transcript_3789/g.14568 Transcript_3789/m.14568 type:complete len:365 (+) Transcript_3789:1085-2179(+)